MNKDNRIKVDVSGKLYHFNHGTTLEEIKDTIKSEEKEIIVAGIIDNQIYDLNTSLNKDCRIRFLTIKDEIGNRIYRRSLFLVMSRAIYELYPDSKLSIEHSLSNGIYCELHKDTPLNQTELDMIRLKMKELIKKDLPIKRKEMSKDQLLQLFDVQGFKDKVELLHQLEIDKCTVYELDGYHDYYFYNMVPRTGYLKNFDLHYRMPGFILLYPQRDNPHQVPEFIDQPKLASIFQEYERWGEIINIENVSDLNQVIQENRSCELIQINEALHEKKVAIIADHITNQIPQKRIILIAGPSSSGKTTFAQRLAIHLRVNGLNPVAISTDNYFVNRENTPLDENGEYDYEALEAIDLELFNQHLISLLQGERIEIPFFNFQKGQREMKGVYLQVTAEQPIIIEGIHSLNELLTSVIPQYIKYRIYVSALTQLNLDRHNRIPTTDTRLIRRLVRDYHFRGHSAAMTINWWPNVRRGEEKNIFPFQENADVMFNSALIYELAVLKRYAEPLLRQIKKDESCYYQAIRLLEILNCFKAMPEDDIPGTSILKEFIGGSVFSH
jgi:uridine kinase